jgi:hypothetical protein
MRRRNANHESRGHYTANHESHASTNPERQSTPAAQMMANVNGLGLSVTKKKCNKHTTAPTHPALQGQGCYVVLVFRGIVGGEIQVHPN